MSKIEANKGIITQINVFTVDPANTDELVALLVEAANAVRHIPGWISANIHRNEDGTRVINYAQCESLQAQEAVMKKLIAGGFLERNKKLGTAHPGLYEVVEVIERDEGEGMRNEYTRPRQS